MELKEIQKNKTKNCTKTIRITEENLNWLKENNISSSKLFERAISEIKTNK